MSDYLEKAAAELRKASAKIDAGYFNTIGEEISARRQIADSYAQLEIVRRGGVPADPERGEALDRTGYDSDFADRLENGAHR
jgi:hypothetical protein